MWIAVNCKKCNFLVISNSFSFPAVFVLPLNILSCALLFLLIVGIAETWSCQRALCKHRGKLWAVYNLPYGGSFIPTNGDTTTRVQETVVGSHKVSSGFSSWPRTEFASLPLSLTPIPPLLNANVAPLGFCCMMDYIQLFRLAGLEECCGCAPSHQLLSQARRNIKAASKRRTDGGLQGSCLIGQSRGALSLSRGWWLIYHSTGEVRPRRPPLLPTTLSHILLTDILSCLLPLQWCNECEHQ